MYLFVRENKKIIIYFITFTKKKKNYYNLTIISRNIFVIIIHLNLLRTLLDIISSYIDEKFWLSVVIRGYKLNTF